MGEVVRRDELESVIAARRELGPEYEDEMVTGLLETIERRLDERAATGAASEAALKRRRDHQKEMILGSMAISIPLLAIAAIFGGIGGIAIVCAALAAIAVAVSRST